MLRVDQADQSHDFQTLYANPAEEQGAIWIVVASAGTMSHLSGVEVWRSGLGGTYRLPTLSSVGASLVPPCFWFHTPLIEPDLRICRIRLSEKTHAIAEAIACDAACDF